MKTIFVGVLVVFLSALITGIAYGQSATTNGAALTKLAFRAGLHRLVPQAITVEEGTSRLRIFSGIYVVPLEFRVHNSPSLEGAVRQAIPMVAETANTGIGMNLAPWNAGSLYIADPKKAAASLGNGTYIKFTNKKGAMTLYQVRDGKFIRVGCRGNGDDCELTDPAGSFQIVNGMMMNRGPMTT